MSEVQTPAPTEGTATETKPAAPAKIIQNGVTRPKAGTVVGQIWDVADSLSAKAGKPAERKDVLAACSGLNAATVATQYGKWRKFHGLMGQLNKDEKAAEKQAKEQAKAAEKAKKDAEKATKKAEKEAAKAAPATPNSDVSVEPAPAVA